MVESAGRGTALSLVSTVWAGGPDEAGPAVASLPVCAESGALTAWPCDGGTSPELGAVCSADFDFVTALLSALVYPHASKGEYYVVVIFLSNRH